MSLVGTIGSGLTWAGCIFINPIIGHLGHIKLVSLAGSSFMSLGLVLGSLCSEVRCHYHLWRCVLTSML